MFMHALDNNNKKYDVSNIEKWKREEQTENSLFSFSILFGLARVCSNSLWNIVYECLSVRMVDSIPKTATT